MSFQPKVLGNDEESTSRFQAFRSTPSPSSSTRRSLSHFTKLCPPTPPREISKKQVKCKKIDFSIFKVRCLKKCIFCCPSGSSWPAGLKWLTSMWTGTCRMTFSSCSALTNTASATGTWSRPTLSSNWLIRQANLVYFFIYFLLLV